MRKVMPIKMEFTYDDLPENEREVERVYNRLLAMAKQNILSGNLIKIKVQVTVSAKAFIVNDRH
jgi:hypothetical protein